MVPFRVLSRINLADRCSSNSSTSSISFASFGLRTLFLSLRSFSDSRPLFSITSALFLQNTRGCGYPNTSAPSFAPAVTCATWRLYPLWPQSIAYTSRHHGGVPLRASGFSAFVANPIGSPFVFILPCPDLRGVQIPFPTCPRWLACPPRRATPLFSQAHRESPTRDRQGGPATGPVICCARRKKRLAESFLFCRGPRAFGVFTGAKRDCGQGHLDESDRRDFFSTCG